MEPALENPAPFIVTSITFLFTIALARYVRELEDLIYGQIQKHEAHNSRLVTNWWLLLIGWWCLILAAVVTLLRIFVSLFGKAKFVDALWISFDFTIIVLMGSGYVLLACQAFRAWKLNSWRGKQWPKIGTTPPAPQKSEGGKP